MVFRTLATTSIIQEKIIKEIGWQTYQIGVSGPLILIAILVNIKL